MRSDHEILEWEKEREDVPSSISLKGKNEGRKNIAGRNRAFSGEIAGVRQRLSSARKFTRGVTFWLNSGPPWNSDSFANGFTAFAAALSLSLSLSLFLSSYSARQQVVRRSNPVKYFRPLALSLRILGRAIERASTRPPFDSKLNFRVRLNFLFAFLVLRHLIK